MRVLPIKNKIQVKNVLNEANLKKIQTSVLAISLIGLTALNGCSKEDYFIKNNEEEKIENEEQDSTKYKNPNDNDMNVIIDDSLEVHDDIIYF